MFILAKRLRQKDELDVMLFEPVLGISHLAGLEAGQGAWRACLVAEGNAERQSSLWAWVNPLAADISKRALTFHIWEMYPSRNTDGGNFKAI